MSTGRSDKKRVVPERSMTNSMACVIDIGDSTSLASVYSRDSVRLLRAAETSGTISKCIQVRDIYLETFVACYGKIMNTDDGAGVIQ